MRRVVAESLGNGEAVTVLQEDGDELWLFNSDAELGEIVDGCNRILTHMSDHLRPLPWPLNIARAALAPICRRIHFCNN